MFVNGINLPSYKSLPQFLNKKPQGAMLSLLDGVLVHRMLSLPLLPLPPPPPTSYHLKEGALKPLV